MKETVFLVRPEAAGWTVTLAGRSAAGPFPDKDGAIAAASRFAAESRARGRYAWIKVIGGDEVVTETPAEPAAEELPLRDVFALYARRIFG